MSLTVFSVGGIILLALRLVLLRPLWPVPDSHWHLELGAEENALHAALDRDLHRARESEALEDLAAWSLVAPWFLTWGQSKTTGIGAFSIIGVLLLLLNLALVARARSLLKRRIPEIARQRALSRDRGGASLR